MLKRTYSKFLILLFFIIISRTYAQDYKKLSIEVCENISKNDSISYENFISIFGKYYNLDYEKNELLLSNFNVFSFNLQKEIFKNCRNKLAFGDSFFLMPLSNIADIEKIFNPEQTKKLEKRLKDIQYKNRLQILVISTNDYFPKQNIDDYSFSILNNNYNDFFENGGIIFVVNLHERNIRISTNSKAKEKLTDEFCQELIDKIVFPHFKNEKYFKGIDEVISQLQIKFQE